MSKRGSPIDTGAYLTRDDGEKDASFEAVVIPEKLGPMRVTVDDALIKQFAFCQDDYHRWHFEASPFGDRIAHAALLCNELLCVYYSQYDRHSIVGLHTEEKLEFVRPIEIGTVVTIRGSYVDKYERRGQGYVVLEAEALDEAGNVLVRHRGVEIMRTKPGKILGRKSAPEPEKRVEVLPTWHGPVTRHVQDYPYGEGRLASMEKTLSQSQISVFSFVGEYVKNIHTDLGVAQEADMDVPIAQGLQSAAHYSEFGTRFFGADWFTGGKLRAKFLSPVFAGDKLRLEGRISDVEWQNGEPSHLNLEMWCLNDDEKVTSVAWLSCSL